jgi:CHASE2 domain-containing sensor protein
VLAAAAVIPVARLPLVQDLENRLVDLRFSISAPRAPSAALAIAIIDEATLAADPESKPTTAYQDELAEVLGSAFTRGVTGVGLDLILPEFWNRSDAFVRFVLTHHDRLALALHTKDEKVYGRSFAEGLITAVLGPDQAARMFGFANLQQDRDGAVRVQTSGFTDLPGRWAPTLPSRITSILGERARQAPAAATTGWVDYRIDWRQIPTWSWKDLPEVLDSRPEEIEGRFLIVGSDIEGSGDSSYPLPHPEPLPDEAPGVIVQALMVETMIAGFPVDEPGAWVPVVAGLLLWPVLMLGLWARRVAAGVAATALFLALYAALGLGLFVWHSQLLELAAPLVTFGLASTAAVALRWKLPARPQPSSGRTR